MQQYHIVNQNKILKWKKTTGKHDKNNKLS